MPQSPDIGQNSYWGISDFQISDQFPVKKIVIIPERVMILKTSETWTKTKFDKGNKTTSKEFDDDIMSKIVTPLSFFHFMTNLEQSESRIPATESAKVMFS